MGGKVKYHVMTAGESNVLVLHPKKEGILHISAMRLEDLQKPTYAERLFADLWKIHQDDHCKGNTFFFRSRDRHGNVTREICKMFTDVCPHCIRILSRRKPVAGVKNIITFGFGVRGQVDLIDFQSMPDGSFVFLLNLIDHGVKKLTCIPLVAKRASTVAFALLPIFTEQGPPRKPYKPTMVVNSHDMRTIMLGAGWCWKMNSLTSSSQNLRTYGLNVKWSEARRDIPNRMEASKG